MLDTWTHARELITKSMMHELEHDYRDNGHYVNPLFLMANSGARGGVEQMRQLAGMRGLMAKPSGEIIETPIKANFREGLTVLEYFSSTHGARKGLADTALKTADSGYLTRKLADICQNMVITTHDCGTTKGITRGVVYRGEKVEVSLADAIRGRVSRTNIVNPITDEVIVREDELITIDIARKIEDMGLEKIQVRSPMTCEATSSACAGCATAWTSRRATSSKKGWRSASSPPRASASRVRSSPCGRSTSAVRPPAKSKRTKSARGGAGRVRYARIRSVVNQEGKNVVLTRNGEIIILDPKERELEKYTVPNGATLLVAEDEEVEVGRVLCQWDPHSVPILAEVGGKVRFEDCIEGRSIRSEREASGNLRRTVIEHKGDLHPQIILEDAAGKILDFYYLPERATIDVQEGQQITAGSILAKNPREATGTQDIVGGLPRVTELFEARKPKDPAIIAEIDGEVELVAEKKRGKRVIIVRGDDSTEVEHIIPHGKQLAGARQRPRPRRRRARPRAPRAARHSAGQRGRGRAAVPAARNPERLPFAARRNRRQAHRNRHRADAAQATRVEDVGDSTMLPGIVIDKFEFRRANEQLMECVKITDPGNTEFQIGDIVPGSTLEEVNAQVEAADQKPAKSTRPTRRDRQHSAPGDHQGGRAERKLHLRGQFPGDDQGPDRGGSRQQGR